MMTEPLTNEPPKKRGQPPPTELDLAYSYAPNTGVFRDAVKGEADNFLTLIKSGKMTWPEVRDLCRISKADWRVIREASEPFDRDGMKRIAIFRWEVAKRVRERVVA